MSAVSPPRDYSGGEALPEEWIVLKESVRRMPATVRAQLEPIVDEALEHARFRNRILTVARDALEQMHHDLELTRFDLDATRREKEDLRRLLRDQD